MPNDDDFWARLRFGMPEQSATVEAVDLDKFRTIDETKWNELVSCRWLQLHQNALILGPSGIGKTFVAAALSRKARHDGYSVWYTSGMRVIQALLRPRTRATRAELLALTSRKDLLVIDEFSPPLFSEGDHAQVIMAFLGDCQFHSSLLLITRLPLAQWHHHCGPTIARQVDRLLAHAHLLDLKTKPCLR